MTVTTPTQRGDKKGKPENRLACGEVACFPIVIRNQEGNPRTVNSHVVADKATVGKASLKPAPQFSEATDDS